MKESPLNRDEKTGGLSGMADRMGGIMPVASAVPTGIAGVKMPERLVGVRLDGVMAVGLDLPTLADREVVAAWRDELGGGPIYVRCTDRAVPLRIQHVQRLARMGELWLDGAVADDEAALDLLVAGAHRLVLWPGEMDNVPALLEALGDSAVIGWNGTTPWADTAALATQFGLPVLAAAEPPAGDGLDVYRADLSATGRFEVLRIHAAAPAAKDSNPARDDAGDDDSAEAEGTTDATSVDAADEKVEGDEAEGDEDKDEEKEK